MFSEIDFERELGRMAESEAIDMKIEDVDEGGATVNDAESGDNERVDLKAERSTSNSPKRKRKKISRSRSRSRSRKSRSKSRDKKSRSKSRERVNGSGVVEKKKDEDNLMNR